MPRLAARVGFAIEENYGLKKTKVKGKKKLYKPFSQMLAEAMDDLDESKKTKRKSSTMRKKTVREELHDTAAETAPPKLGRH